MKQFCLSLIIFLASPANLASAEEQADKPIHWLVIKRLDITDGELEETITIPLSVLKIASEFVPSAIRAELESDGIAIDEIVRLAGEEELRGPIARIDDGRTGERWIIAIE